ncbi:stage V sporulation protein AB [Alkalihalophilus pseudofirmus]|uniref:stage V sporulation protein AB n=1 Tax=Alkalihalobacterium alkalinitrilicum TaxID=427920 RepID=UPI00094C9C25|nr:stage V sporulation protein AB [Alkalihalobacterium alkalinitrilicum]OLO42671.1 stage V sporulation protein AB [Alkalihalophilus pseudofirmus]
MTIEAVLSILIGLAGGFAVGGGFVAFLTVLGVVPRLTQLSKTGKYIHIYEWAVILGALTGSLFSLNNIVLHLSALLLIPIGLAEGIFIGLLAAALTEVLNVFPILAKRLGIAEKIIVLMMAIVLGKVFGSLFHWIYFVDQ